MLYKNPLFLILLGTILSNLVISIVKNHENFTNFEWFLIIVALLISLGIGVLGIIKFLNKITFKN